MFKKEAKERAEKLEEKQTLGIYDNDEDLARDKGFNEGQVVGYEEGFNDGAEYGYNKAKGEVKELLKTLIKNCPDTYSGTDASLSQKRMFRFQDARNKAELFLKEVEK